MACFTTGDTYLELNTINNAIKNFSDEEISEEKLKVLVDRLNSKKVKIGFIPPVKVRELGLDKIKLK